MQSEQIDQLATALSKAQGMMKSAAKDVENTFYHSSYADLAAVMAACREPLSKNGLAIIQTTQYEGEATWLETTLAHASGQWVRSRYPVRPIKNDPQGIGSALTYARRYALMSMVGVVASDDDDGNEASGKHAGNGSGDIPPLQRPKAPDPKVAALKWVKEAKATVNNFGRISDLRAWDDSPKVQEYLTRLKAVDIDLFDQINGAISDGFRRLSPANA